MQKSAKNSKKFVYYNENMYTDSKFQTQLSRKLQRFRTCRKNKKCSIFHEISEYQQKWATFFPLVLYPPLFTLIIFFIACVAEDRSVIQIGRTFIRNGIRHKCNVDGE